MNIRQQLVECLVFIEGLEQLGDEIIQLQQQIVCMQNDENRCDERKDRFRTIFLIVTGFAALFIGAAIASVSVYMNESGVSLQQLLMMAKDIGVTSDITVLSVPMIAIAVIVGFGYAWSRSARKLRRMVAENRMKRQRIEAKIQEIQAHMRERFEYGREEGYFNIVPSDYFSSEMLRYGISVIDRRLATTLQEAFLLLEQELQRQEQMAQHQQMYFAQAEQMERLTNAVNVNTMATILLEQERRR